MTLKRTMTMLFVGGLSVCGLAVMPAVARAAPEDHAGHHAKAAQPAATPATCKMCESMMGRMKTIAKLKATLAEAKGLAEGEGATKTVAKLNEALALLGDQDKAMHAAMKQHMAKMHQGHHAMADQGEVVNARCPIMRGKLDRAKVPASLTRVWKGQKVGFCCGGCPKAWDKLTDEQKQEKLDAVLAGS